jgi:hypothetical protein
VEVSSQLQDPAALPSILNGYEKGSRLKIKHEPSHRATRRSWNKRQPLVDDPPHPLPVRGTCTRHVTSKTEDVLHLSPFSFIPFFFCQAFSLFPHFRSLLDLSFPACLMLICYDICPMSEAVCVVYVNLGILLRPGSRQQVGYWALFVSVIFYKKMDPTRY